jgi:glutamate racemase
MSAAHSPIGVMLRELRSALPDTDFIYLGDAARAPYGGRDVETILDLAEQCVELLFAEGCRVVIVACHTVSCVALRHLQKRHSGDRRVLGVTIPAAEAAVGQTRGRIGFLGTARTVTSHTFRTEVRKLAPSIEVVEVAAPLLAPIVEEGWEDTDIARLAVRRYVAALGEVATIVLGCTHYPLLASAFAEAVPPGVSVLNPAPFLAGRFVDWLARHPEFSSAGTGRLRVLCSGDGVRFATHAGRFLGEKPPPIEHVAEVAGRLAFCPEGHEPQGQIVR